MLDAVLDFLAVADRHHPAGLPASWKTVKKAERRARLTTKSSRHFAFKIMTDPFVRPADLFSACYSGIVNSGDTVLNATKDKKERLGRISADARETSAKKIKEVRAGRQSLPASLALKTRPTGDTLCDPQKTRSCLETHDFPGAGDFAGRRAEDEGPTQEKDGGWALNRLAQEDPSFRVQERTEESGQKPLFSGMGELPPRILVDRMKREFGRRGNGWQAAGGLPAKRSQHGKPTFDGQVRQAVGPAAASNGSRW